MAGQLQTSCPVIIREQARMKLHRHSAHETLSTPASAVNCSVKNGGKKHRAEDILFGVKSSSLHCCLFNKGLYLFKSVDSCGCHFFSNTKGHKSFEVV